MKDKKLLLLFTFALSLTGTLFTASSAAQLGIQLYSDPLSFFKHALVYFFIGWSIFFIIIKLPSNHVKKYIDPLFYLSLILLIVTLIPGISHKINGARRWINLIFISFQTSELIKLTLGLKISKAAAFFLSLKSNISGFIIQTTIYLIPISILIAMQPDYGSMALIVTTVFLFFLYMGINFRFWLSITTVVFVILIIGALLAPYRLQRITSNLNPWAHMQTTGYQIVQALYGIGDGGFLGQGLGSGKQKLGYLPEAHTDFVYSVFSEELGMLGSATFLFVFLNVVFLLYKMAKKVTDPFDKSFILWTATILGLQGFLNVFMVLNLIPVIGVPLPFLSYGGTSEIINLIMIALCYRFYSDLPRGLQ
jgi:cell division protein FtsW